jgi:GTP-dependent phosphoenolpyruvate carboxykinase
MKNTVELTDQEVSIIESALNSYWNEAHEQLETKKVMMSDGSKRPLGFLEEKMLQQRKGLVYHLLVKFENL